MSENIFDCYSFVQKMVYQDLSKCGAGMLLNFQQCMVPPKQCCSYNVCDGRVEIPAIKTCYNLLILTIQEISWHYLKEAPPPTHCFLDSIDGWAAFLRRQLSLSLRQEHLMSFPTSKNTVRNPVCTPQRTRNPRRIGGCFHFTLEKWDMWTMLAEWVNPWGWATSHLVHFTLLNDQMLTNELTCLMSYEKMPIMPVSGGDVPFRNKMSRWTSFLFWWGGCLTFSWLLAILCTSAHSHLAASELMPSSSSGADF